MAELRLPLVRTVRRPEAEAAEAAEAMTLSSTSTLAIIPTFVREQNDVEISKAAIYSLRRTAPEVDILVVDDHSEDLGLVDQLDAAAKEVGADVRAPATERWLRQERQRRLTSCS
jgi:hypothetical protein